MKVRVKTPFYDDNGIHKRGDVIEVKKFNPDRMELVPEEKEKKAEPKRFLPKRKDKPC